MVKTQLNSDIFEKKEAAILNVTESIKKHGEIESTIKEDKSSKTGRSEYYKAMTVKLDKDRFTKLKQAGLAADLSSQEIFVAALDAYLSHSSV
jgi:hypothetical protein